NEGRLSSLPLDQGCRLLYGLFTYVKGHNIGAFAREQKRRRASHSRARPGDQRYPILQPHMFLQAVQKRKTCDGIELTNEGIQNPRIQESRNTRIQKTRSSELLGPPGSFYLYILDSWLREFLDSGF